MKKPEVRLGELLIGKKKITKEQLEDALAVQKETGEKLGEVLTKSGYISEEGLAKALSEQLRIPYVSLSKGNLKPDLEQDLEEIIPARFANANKVLPISKHLGSLTVAFIDPLNLMLKDNIRKITGYNINPVITTNSEITTAISEFYGKDSALRDAIKSTYGEENEDGSLLKTYEEKEDEDFSLDNILAKAKEAPVVKLVDLLIKQAVEERASDIHIEPFKDRIRVRYRIDGILHEISPPAKHLHMAIISRIKILSRMDIAEKRLPQDGSFMVNLNNRLIDLRVSTVPTSFGEKVVIRILDKSSTPLELSELGFSSEESEKFAKAITQPYGLILLTGPTGSGKSTTLYAALNKIKDPTKNITTIEDPIEYRFEGINQVSARPDIGLTFATGMRSFLRQDPDIIMVGEVRDAETATICVRAALTGHIVFSTLHTNDATTVCERLKDLGIDPFLINSSLLMVIAQRLVRRLCPECKKGYEPTKEERNKLGKFGENVDMIYKPQGCEYCNMTGFRGRVGIFEMMEMNDRLRRSIAKELPAEDLRQIAQESGMRNLWDSGMEKVAQGITSIDEVSRVTLTIL